MFLKRKIIILISAFFTATVLINFRIDSVSKAYIFQKSGDIPKTQAVLILGASVFADGRLSDMLKDRADTAMELYRAGKAEKILASGDHGVLKYDETNAMKKYLLSQGIPSEDVFLDYAGFDTYDSVYRAKEIFGAKSLIISTQDFHLPRAVYIAKNLGIDVYGISADKHAYGGIEKNRLREIFAKVKAFLDVNFHAKPEFLGKQIPLEGDGRKSWD